ncbi:hypothetical protein KIN20_003272 [Parelaphostrongylus tenuis]|uniref:Uncharacterized protein n=1 Tax=Parelaphostrongylus tenuis TaxID=148309 RepID=A0AAD5QIH8_PARTN|nr:hypothetical protein KIN20_003272 [Parelaphostrongylus tenuis]
MRQLLRTFDERTLNLKRRLHMTLDGLFNVKRALGPSLSLGSLCPTATVYSANAAVAARFPGIASNQAGAQGFVQRLVMQTVLDVLERQARSALLPDAVISTFRSTQY